MRTFWDKQPVPQEGVTYERGKEIEKERKVVTESIKLPEGFSWDQPSLEEAHLLLNEYYVRDETFTLSYSIETLKWAAEIPGYENRGIRHDESGQLVGYISSVPTKIRVCEDVLDMVQINFLCIHPKYREKGFAPILISEIKRIANTHDIWQAVYTAFTKIPTPVAKSSYWHRFLNVKRLVKTGFYSTNRLREKYFELRGSSQFREMKTKDIPKVTRILEKYFKQFKVAPVIDKTWVKHWILPIHSYVNDETDDFISFYEIPYDRVDGTDTVKQVYNFYIVGDVYNDAFILARNKGYDVFNTLDVGQNCSDLERLKFIKGSGHVHYYLFNWLPSSGFGSEDIQLKLP
jgi:glycylpeptide N-tetradecanoyltransferase